MKTYGVGTMVFCDFHFVGKPSGKVVQVVNPGDGKSNEGTVIVELTETVRAYRKGERLEVSTYYAVPKAQELKLKAGQYFRRISTLYRYE
jgi:hypothetical protein